MKKNTLKLAVALIAFIIGVTGTTFWLLVSFPSRKLNTEPQQLIRLIVTGRVLDNAGRPIRGAKVQAGLGLDCDGTRIETDADGRFRAEAASPYWCKGYPTVRANAAGYAEEWFYFDRQDWETGERQFEQTIILKPKAVKLAENRSLWQEKKNYRLRSDRQLL